MFPKHLSLFHYLGLKKLGMAGALTFSSPHYKPTSSSDWLETDDMLAIFQDVSLSVLQGLRRSVILGSFGTCLGSWIKVMATSRDMFALLFSGQTIVAISQVFILGIPAQLAATWFPAHQVSSACAIGVFGNQVRVHLSFYQDEIGFLVNQEQKQLNMLQSPSNLSHLEDFFFPIIVFCQA